MRTIIVSGALILGAALGWLTYPRDGASSPSAIPTSGQAIAAATYEALMQLDCDQTDTADDNCTDELQDANTAPTVLSIRRAPGGMWRVVLQFHLTGGPGVIAIPETVG